MHFLIKRDKIERNKVNVWIMMENTSEPELSTESFIIGSSKSQEDAITEACSELERIIVGLRSRL